MADDLSKYGTVSSGDFSKYGTIRDPMDETRAALEASAPKTLLDKVKSVGEVVISPITGIPGAVREVAKFIADPGSVRDRNLNPETAAGVPGAMSVNPIAEAYGNLIAAGLTARGAPVYPNKAAILNRIGTAEAAPAPAATARLTPADAINLLEKAWKFRKFTPGRILDSAVEAGIDALKGKLAEPAAPAAPAPPVEATQLAPVDLLQRTIQRRVAPQAKPISQANTPTGPAAPIAEQMPPAADVPANAIPANASPSQLMRLPTKQVGDYLNARPAVEPAEAPEAPAPTTEPAASPEATPAAPKRSKGGSQPGKDAKSLTSKLQEWGFTPDEAGQMDSKGWAKLAFDAGVPMPTKSVQGNAIFGLKKALAGPVRTPQQLFDAFKAAAKKANPAE